MTTPAFHTAILVDDNPADNFLHKLVIEEARAVPKTVSFESARHALAFLIRREANDSSLLLLDINMPDMSGFRFLEEFEKLPSEIRESVRVVMLSTSLNSDDRAACEAHPHVTRFLNKPLTLSKIKELISDLSPS